MESADQRGPRQTKINTLELSTQYRSKNYIKMNALIVSAVIFLALVISTNGECCFMLFHSSTRSSAVGLKPFPIAAHGSGRRYHGVDNGKDNRGGINGQMNGGDEQIDWKAYLPTDYKQVDYSRNQQTAKSYKPTANTYSGKYKVSGSSAGSSSRYGNKKNSRPNEQYNYGQKYRTQNKQYNYGQKYRTPNKQYNYGQKYRSSGYQNKWQRYSHGYVPDWKAYAQRYNYF